ncbi:MAG: methionine--tRNA ligase [Candidatus Gracilibacteria bacterium]|nr:methionine--tRNA ligase [Candidatus Gracilibacteria bacterium]
MKKETFYITTPIYYGNGVPHIGHTYTSLITNVIFNYQKISGKNARFTTGIDENSQKAVLKAKEAGMEIMDYLDEMTKKHKAVWDFFNINYTDFIRTTELRHHKLVQEVLQICFDRGDIYEGVYEGMYCVGCEAFKKDDDLVYMNKTTNKTFPITKDIELSDNIVKVCGDHLKEPDKIKEKNYFFKLSKYQTWIEEFYLANPDFVKPDFRYNEVKAFVSRGLEDFSISRETNTFGIPLPFDKTQVTYVWFDALFNYYTSCKYSRGGNKNNEDFINESNEFWIENPNKVHVVGKDIIRFHAIFWPCMLASYFGLGEKDNSGVIHYKDSDKKYLPTTILTGGYFTVDGQKMSKTIGNVIEPIEYATKYSRELLTLYMLGAFPIGLDGDYDRQQAILTYNSKLANNLGNLVNRVVVLSLKIGGILERSVHSGKINSSGTLFKLEDLPIDKRIPLKNSMFFDEIILRMETYNLKGVLDYSFMFLDELNDFTTQKEPWQTIKDETKLENTKEVLYTIAEGLRQVGLALYSFFPEKMGEMFAKLGLKGYVERLENGELEKLIGEILIFEITEKGENLFNRFDV